MSLKIIQNGTPVEATKIWIGGDIQAECLRVWSTEANAWVYESSAELTGTLPLTFRSNGTALIDYRIYGNTVDMPVNLWTATGSQYQLDLTTPLKAGKTYTYSVFKEDIADRADNIYMYDSNNARVTYGTCEHSDGNRIYVTLTPNKDVWRVTVNNTLTDALRMLTAGDTPPDEYISPETTEVQGVGVRTESLRDFVKEYRDHDWGADATMTYAVWTTSASELTMSTDFVKTADMPYLFYLRSGLHVLPEGQTSEDIPEQYAVYAGHPVTIDTASSDGVYTLNVMLRNRQGTEYEPWTYHTMLVEGSTAPASYIPYGYKLPMVSRNDLIGGLPMKVLYYADGTTILGRGVELTDVPAGTYTIHSKYNSNSQHQILYIDRWTGTTRTRVVQSPLREAYTFTLSSGVDRLDVYVPYNTDTASTETWDDVGYEYVYLTADSTETPIYIGTTQLMQDEYVSYGDQAIYKRMVPENTDDTVIYGFHVNPDESDPADAVTYLEDAVGMTPAAMGSTAFNYGSWANTFFMPKPCMLKFDGTVDYYLDPNDYSKKLDGTDSDYNNLAYEGNAMMEWPLIWYKFEAGTAKGEGYFYVSNKKVDDSYQCWCNYDSQNYIIDHFYTAIYNGCTYDGKMRSISGLQLTPWSTTAYSASATYAVGAKVNYQGKMYRCTTAVETAEAFDPDKWKQFAFNGQTTGQESIAQAMACNTTSDTEWYIDLWADRTLITGLLYLMGKSLDLQSTFGRGLDSGNQAAKEAYVTGALDDKGLFWGVTANGNNGVKVFGMENFWGCEWHRTAGLIGISTGYAYKLTHGTADGSTATAFGTTSAGYNKAAVAKPASGYVTKMLFGKNGMLPIATGGSESTYECDNYYNGSGFAFVGGGSHSGLVCGFSVAVNNAVEARYWHVAAAPSCKPLAKTVPTDPPVPLPELPTFSNTNTVLEYEETPAPEEVWVKYHKK